MSDPVLQSGRRDLRHTLSYALVGLLVLGVAVSLPFALASVAHTLRHGDGDRFGYTTGAATSHPAFRLHLDIAGIDQGGGFVTVRATAARGCGPDCPTSARLMLFSALADPGGLPFQDAEFLPVIQALEFPVGVSTLSEELRLPIYGAPIHYPFDLWRLSLHVTPELTLADGSRQMLSVGAPEGLIVFSVQNRTPRLELTGQTLDAGGQATAQLGVGLRFERPLFLKVITVLLVLLIGAAAAYATFLRPLNELIVNVSALVLGIWGVRAVLLGTTLDIVTAVDLALMSVILFLLAMLTLRMFWALEERSRVALLHGIVAWWRTRQVS